MKRAIVILSVVAAVASMSSCKKDFTCECTITEQTTKSPILDSKKADAESACEALETAGKVVDADATCTLK